MSFVGHTYIYTHMYIYMCIMYTYMYIYIYVFFIFMSYRTRYICIYNNLYVKGTYFGEFWAPEQGVAAVGVIPAALTRPLWPKSASSGLDAEQEPIYIYIYRLTENNIHVYMYM